MSEAGAEGLTGAVELAAHVVLCRLYSLDFEMGTMGKNVLQCKHGQITLKHEQ